FHKLLSSSERRPIQELRQKLDSNLRGRIDCRFVESCGDLSKIQSIAGTRYNPHHRSDLGYSEAWEIFRELQSLFEEARPSLEDTKPRSSLAEYLKDRSRVQRFVRRHGLKRRLSSPEEPFDINIVADGKQGLNWFRPGTQFPYLYSDPVRDLHDELFAF